MPCGVSTASGASCSGGTPWGRQQVEAACEARPNGMVLRPSLRGLYLAALVPAASAKVGVLLPPPGSLAAGLVVLGGSYCITPLLRAPTCEKNSISKHCACAETRCNIEGS